MATTIGPPFSARSPAIPANDLENRRPVLGQKGFVDVDFCCQQVLGVGLSLGVGEK